MSSGQKNLVTELNIIAVLKTTRPDIRLLSGIVMPILSTAAMGVVIYFMYSSLAPAFGNTMATLLCLLTAVLVYIVMLFITGSIKKDDMEYIPGGRQVAGLMNKLGFWRQS